jgi:hypothetical protein
MQLVSTTPDLAGASCGSPAQARRRRPRPSGSLAQRAHTMATEVLPPKTGAPKSRSGERASAERRHRPAGSQRPRRR